MSRKNDNTKLINKYETKINELKLQNNKLNQQVQNLTKINEFDKYNKYVMKQLELNAIKRTSSVYITGTNNRERIEVTLNLLDDYMDNSNKSNLLIISPKNHDIFKKLYPRATIKSNFNANDIERYTNKLRVPNTNNTKYCVIMDDCFIDSLDMMNDSVIDLLETVDSEKQSNMEFIKYPDVKIIITSKKCRGYYIIKKNIDYVILLKSTDTDIQHRYFVDYGQMFLTFDVFQKFFLGTTNKYDCMIINTEIYRKDLSNHVHGFNINKYNNIENNIDSDSDNNNNEQYNNDNDSDNNDNNNDSEHVDYCNNQNDDTSE